jgi:hypothetical protein
MSRNYPQTAWRPVCPDRYSEHVPQRRSARKLRRGRAGCATISAATSVPTHLACRSRPSPQQNRPRLVKQTPAFPTRTPKQGYGRTTSKRRRRARSPRWPAREIADDDQRGRARWAAIPRSSAPNCPPPATFPQPVRCAWAISRFAVTICALEVAIGHWRGPDLPNFSSRASVTSPRTEPSPLAHRRFRRLRFRRLWACARRCRAPL